MQNQGCILLGGKWGRSDSMLRPPPLHNLTEKDDFAHRLQPPLTSPTNSTSVPAFISTQIQWNCNSSQLQTMNCEEDDCATDTTRFHQILVTSHKLCCHLILALEQLGWVGVGSENCLSYTEVFSKSQNMGSCCCYYYFNTSWFINCSTYKYFINHRAWVLYLIY